MTEELSDAIIDLVANSPQDRIIQLAASVASLTNGTDTRSPPTWSLSATLKSRMDRLMAAWRGTDITSAQLSGMLIGASNGYHAARTEQEVELVWTGPPSQLVATRKTEQALLQVIAAARSKLFLTSFVLYEVDSVMDAIEKATRHGVEVSLLVEANISSRTGISIDAVATTKSRLPEASIYSWTKKSEVYVGGKVHAKVAVADEILCFVSSANLTGHAMEKNMEAGILIKGGNTPRDLHRHLMALVATGVIERV